MIGREEDRTVSSREKIAIRKEVVIGITSFLDRASRLR